MKNKTRKETQFKFYKVKLLLALLYGSKSWTIKRKDISKIHSAEMR